MTILKMLWVLELLNLLYKEDLMTSAEGQSPNTRSTEGSFRNIHLKAY